MQPLTINKTTILRAVAYNQEGEASNITTCSYLFPFDILYQTEHPEGYPDTWGRFLTIDSEAPADYGMDVNMANDDKYRNNILEGFKSLPIISLVTDKENLFSHEKDSVKGGIYIYTGVENDNLGEIDKTGRGWERPVSCEFFVANTDDDFTIDCGLKLHGGNSRFPECTPKHSFRLHFKKKYVPSKLEYKVFGDEGPSEFNTPHQKGVVITKGRKIIFK